MKMKIMLGGLLVVLGTGFSVAALDDGPIPICRPGKPCQIEPKKFDGGPDPLCRPGAPCPIPPGSYKTAASGGDPDMICRPGIPSEIQK